MKKYAWLAITLISLLFTTSLCNAQIDLSAGIGIAYPELFTSSKIINSGQISSGIHLSAAWRPEELKFFPGIGVSYGATRLPLQYEGNNVAALNFRYLAIMINEYCGADYANRLVLNAGIGATYMNCTGAAPSGNETRQTSIDSTANITQIFPAVNLGLEYAAYKTEHFSVGFGLSIRYNLLFEAKNTYYITVSEPGNKIYDYTTNLSGQLVTPGLYVAAHYNIHSKK